MIREPNGEGFKTRERKREGGKKIKEGKKAPKDELKRATDGSRRERRKTCESLREREFVSAGGLWAALNSVSFLAGFVRSPDDDGRSLMVDNSSRELENWRTREERDRQILEGHDCNCSSLDGDDVEAGLL